MTFHLPQLVNESAHEDRTQLERLRREHAAVVRALQEAVRDTTRLTRLFAVLNELGPLEQLLADVVATLSELFVSDVVVLLDATQPGRWAPLAAIGIPWGSEFRALPDPEDGHAARALRAGSPVAVTEAKLDPRVEPTLRELDVETAVWLPMVGEHRVLRGVLILARCRPQAFAAADVDLLSTMAYRVGLLVERAHAERERQLLELRVRQAEKTESLGRMAAAVAHRFNNMLGVVLAGLDLALEELPRPHATRDDLVRAREAALRAAETGELMLTYIGQSTGERELVDLAQQVRTGLPGLQGALPGHVGMKVELGSVALMVTANPPQLLQMLGHLVTNAAEAIGARTGEIRLTLSTVPSHAVHLEGTPSANWASKATTYACLELSDTGCGMSNETLGKIFDPFFTTKFVGRGLGLAVVQGTVRAHGGQITVESDLGRGTTVRVYLPLAQPVVEPSTPPVPLPLPRLPGKPLVLVAEDEVTLLRSTQRILKGMGCEVLTAADGVDAAAQFRSRMRDIGLVILDLAMPRMDGWAVFEVIRQYSRDVPVIIASGYDESHAMQGHPRHPSVVFLHKPYAVAELRQIVDRFISASSPS